MNYIINDEGYSLVIREERKIIAINEHDKIGDLFLRISFPKAPDTLITYAQRYGCNNKYFERHVLSPFFDIGTLKPNVVALNASKILEDLRKQYPDYSLNLLLSYEDAEGNFADFYKKANLTLPEGNAFFHFYYGVFHSLYKTTYDFYERFIHRDCWHDFCLCVVNEKRVGYAVPPFSEKSIVGVPGLSKPAKELIDHIDEVFTKNSKY